MPTYTPESVISTLNNDQLLSNPKLRAGLLHYQLGELSRAVSLFREVLDDAPDNSALLFMVALLYTCLGDEPQAEEHFRRSVASGTDFDALYGFGLYQHSKGRAEEAIALLMQAHAVTPGNAELMNDLAVMHFELRNLDAAAGWLVKALALRPDYQDALVNLAKVHMFKRDEQKFAQTVGLLRQHGFERQAVQMERMRTRESQASRTGAPLDVKLVFADKLYEIKPFLMAQRLEHSCRSTPVGLSVIVPIKDEVDNLPILYKEINTALQDLQQNYEIIFIDDGSRDGSLEVMENLAGQDPRVKVIVFRRNYGQTAALSAGFKAVSGEIVITLDGDLQNDPADIPKLLGKLAEGYDLVNGWRKDRQDKFLSRKLPSMIANRIINKLIEGTGIQLHDFGCTLKAYKVGIVKNINLYGEMHRFIPVFAAWLGVKVAEVPVNHRPRVHGKAKYNLSRVSRVIFDLLVVRFFSDYMTRPIQFFGRIAKFIAGYSLLGIGALGVLKVLFGLPVSFDTLLVLTAIILFGALQIVCIGLTGEIPMRSYFETQKKDSFVVERIVDGAKLASRQGKGRTRKCAA